MLYVEISKVKPIRLQRRENMNLIGTLAIALIGAIAAPTLAEHVGVEIPAFTQDASAIDPVTGNVCTGDKCVWLLVSVAPDGVVGCVSLHKCP